MRCCAPRTTLDHAAGLLQVPSREVAEQRKVAHNRTLRKRWLVADTRRKAASRKEGLAAVATHYTPRHPQVYSSTIAPSDLARRGHCPGRSGATLGREPTCLSGLGRVFRPPLFAFCF